MTVEMMLNPSKYGLTQCDHCNGYGSSLKERGATCSKCGGSGLVKSATPTSHTEAINAANQPQPVRRRLFWPCNPNKVNPPEHKNCTGEFDFLGGHEVCTCTCHQPLAVAPADLPDTSVSILAALACIGTPQEPSLFRSHHPSCSYLKSGREQGPHDCGPERIVAPADLPAAIASRQPFVVKEGDREMVVS